MLTRLLHVLGVRVDTVGVKDLILSLARHVETDGGSGFIKKPKELAAEAVIRYAYDLETGATTTLAHRIEEVIQSVTDTYIQHMYITEVELATLKERGTRGPGELYHRRDDSSYEVSGFQDGSGSLSEVSEV